MPFQSLDRDAAAVGGVKAAISSRCQTHVPEICAPDFRSCRGRICRDLLDLDHAAAETSVAARGCTDRRPRSSAETIGQAASAVGLTGPNMQ